MVDCKQEEDESNVNTICIIPKPVRRGRPKSKNKDHTIMKNTTFCDICEKAFVDTKWGAKIARHKFLEHDIRNCAKCGKICDDVTKFLAHIGSHCPLLPKVKLKCEYCGQELANKIRLREHIKAKHTERKEHCDICDEMVVSLSEHNDQKHSLNPSNLVTCHLCGHTSSKIGMYSHLMRQHKEFVKINCPHCGKQVRDINLSHHIKRTQCDRPAEERHFKKFVCNLCEKTYQTEGKLQRHIKDIHNQERNFECDQCEYKTYMKSNLYMHVKRVHEKRALHVSCPHCDEQVINVDYHVKTYHKDII